MIVTLAGGTGAARFLAGLQLVRPADQLTAVVNTADDFVLHGLTICPDVDSVVYNLAGRINPETGWGLAGETWRAMEALERLGGQAWFRLGDQDLATHLFRSQRLAEGATLSEVTGELARGFGIGMSIVPMSDEPVRTMLTLTDGAEISFQDYFVRLHHDVAVAGVRFEGAEEAPPAPLARAALTDAQAVVIAPSNPLVSIGPILAVPGIREVIAAQRDRTVAISPIVGGQALKGPADRMLRELGHRPDALGVARLYRDIASVLVIDEADRDLAEAIRAEGVGCVVTDTIMRNPQVAGRLAEECLAALDPPAEPAS